MLKKNTGEPGMLKKLLPSEFEKANKGKSPAINSATSKNATKEQQAQAAKDKNEKDKVLADKELSSEEKLALIEIKPIEKKALEKAFRRLCRATTGKENGDESFVSNRNEEEDKGQKKGAKVEENKIKEYFTAEDVGKVLLELHHNASKPEIELMIWEVDENLDKRVDREEFELMFRRCIEDETGLEPKSLFNLVQFLMYAKEDAIEITEEDTLELIYVRKNSIKGLEDALKIIFGEEERRVDGIEKKIDFTEFLDRRNKRALKLRREEKQAKKEARSTLKKNDM